MITFIIAMMIGLLGVTMVTKNEKFKKYKLKKV